jgi:ECF transporter S component (folate family)
MPKISTKHLTAMALLIALEIILSRFLSLSAWNTKIGFSFVPVVIAAILLGPIYAGIVGALADFVGALLFPIGAYFPGFTLTAFLTGMVYGLFLYKRQSLPRILGAVAVNQFILSLLLNTLWISVLYGSPFGPLLVTRLVQSAILTVVQIVVIELIVKALPRLRRGFSA